METGSPREGQSGPEGSASASREGGASDEAVEAGLALLEQGQVRRVALGLGRTRKENCSREEEGAGTA